MHFTDASCNAVRHVFNESLREMQIRSEQVWSGCKVGGKSSEKKDSNWALLHGQYSLVHVVQNGWRKAVNKRWCPWRKFLLILLAAKSTADKK